MRNSTAGAYGGLAGGLLTTGVMTAGRRTGLLHKTLAEHAKDWLDLITGARRHIGDRGITFVEQANHLGAAAAFGSGYGLLRSRLPLPALLAGALYGGCLYAVNIAGIAPRMGLTEGETAAPTAVSVQRLTMHVLFGVTTALVAERLMDQPRYRRQK
ncbi:MAG TPA: hypothetical protein VFG67_11380 [Oleiagrimonas sp.]|nr:hypothetical protein [Oleiagrimonas sp.]